MGKLEILEINDLREQVEGSVRRYSLTDPEYPGWCSNCNLASDTLEVLPLANERRIHYVIYL